MPPVPSARETQFGTVWLRLLEQSSTKTEKPVAKNMSLENIIYFVLIPIAVYGLARIVFTAYFKSKADYLRRLFHGNNKTEDPGER